jgi:hypothetical protein
MVILGAEEATPRDALTSPCALLTHGCAGRSDFASRSISSYTGPVPSEKSFLDPTRTRRRHARCGAVGTVRGDCVCHGLRLRRATPRHSAGRLGADHAAQPDTATASQNARSPNSCGQVDNAPEARPARGLGNADLVYIEPVEGGRRDVRGAARLKGD